MNTLDKQELERSRIERDYAYFKVACAEQQATYDAERASFLADGLDILEPRDIAWERAMARAERRTMPSFADMKRRFIEQRELTAYARAIGEL